ncbi:MAG: hypothetical protein O3C15_10065 [Proteobacteria bacterium]|nr:hypothetical protein [Pseudomonadota bacterium]
MARAIIESEARLLVCRDGYEAFGRRRAEGGLASLPESSASINVVAAKTLNLEVVYELDASKIWRSLIRIFNTSKVSGRPKVLSEVVRFCNQFGLPTLEPMKIRSKKLSSVCIDDLLLEAKRLSDAISLAGGGYVDAPDDVVKAFQLGSTVSMAGINGHQTLTIEGALLSAWFNLINSGPQEYRECEFCGGLNVSRAKSRFCTAPCRDRYHKKVRK